jgi:sulfite exporter TauE/SafE
VVVGAAMMLAGGYVLRLRCSLHLHLWPPSVGACHKQIDAWGRALRTPTPAMAAVHGFIAGWGMGAFALIMATVLAPAMPNAALGWAPGVAFGLGTTSVLVGAGAVIGALVRHQRLSQQLAQQVAQAGPAGRSCSVGGSSSSPAPSASRSPPS